MELHHSTKSELTNLFLDKDLRLEGSNPSQSIDKKIITKKGCLVKLLIGLGCAQRFLDLSLESLNFKRNLAPIRGCCAKISHSALTNFEAPLYLFLRSLNIIDFTGLALIEQF